MPIIRTKSMITLDEFENPYEQEHYDNWMLNYGVWFRDMIAKFDSNSLTGTRYLYSKSVAQGRAGCTLCIAHVSGDVLELGLGWIAELDQSYYWSLFAFLTDTYPDRYVTADLSHSLIWVR
jgi:hypothetical protein